MNRTQRTLVLALAASLSLTQTACDGGRTPADAGPDHAPSPTPASPGTVAIPTSVRSNLGITFVKVERRRVERTLRVPGRFEYQPSARREYRTAVPGRVELLVEQFERVEAGRPLYRLDAPAWREMQRQLAQALSDIERLDARLEAFEPLMATLQQHEASLHESVAVWSERVEQLHAVRETGGGRADELAQARASLAGARAESASVLERQAQLSADHGQAVADRRASRSRYDSLLDGAGSMVARSREELAVVRETANGPVPHWATISTIEVRATQAGVVEMLGLTNGSWADETTPVLTIVQPDRLRFRAYGLQSDLGVLRDGLDARIVPTTPTTAGRAVPMTDTMRGTLSLGLRGDPDDHTVELYVVPEAVAPWARPGVSAQLEIVTDANAAPELAIPLAAVQRDGLVPVIFRRNPKNPNEALRVEADLGLDDGRWVVLLSGVRDGDEVVLDGAFQLMLATSGSIEKGGHFHADGTFHQGEDQ